MALPTVATTTEALAHAGWAAQARWQVQRQWRRLQARLRSTWQPLTLALLAPPHAPGDATGMDAAINAALDALDVWAAEHEGSNVVVQLSSRWLLCSATPDAANALQAREVAQQQWTHYFGLEPQVLASDWQLSEVIHASASPTAAEVRLVCAVPRALIDGLKAVARERGLALQAAMPWWSEGLQAAWEADLTERPAAAQVEGSQRRWGWAEPGVLTQAQAEVREGRWVLVRLWSELRVDADAHGPETGPEAELQALAALLPSGLAWPASSPTLGPDPATEWVVWPLDAAQPAPAVGVAP